MKVVIIGSGNVGYHLAKRFRAVGVNIVQIFSRSEAKAKRLANIIQVPYSTNLAAIATEADVYIIAVSDTNIGEVQEQLAEVLPKNALLVHTSGVTPQKVFTAFPNHGVFYPLQTFSVARTADFSIIPLCIDAAWEISRERLTTLAKQIAPNVYHITDEQRAKLHVAAVFINNFSNHLAQIAYEITAREGLSFDLLRPLMLETALKIQEHIPAEVQTGPAIRKDESTIQRHLAYLEYDEDVQAIYQLLTDSIRRQLDF